MQDGQVPKPKKKSRGLDWILWWRTDPDEIEEQALHYTEYGLRHSARGVASFLLLLSAVLTVLLIAFAGYPPEAYVDAGLMLALALFICLGHRWAMIAAMMLWTLEKAVQVLGAPLTVVVAIFWWAAYMHAFLVAFKVEAARRKIAPNHAAIAEF